MDRSAYRRLFLKFLATSPLLAFGPGWRDDGAAASDAESGIPKRVLIASPNEAMNVFDFESVARPKLPPAHFGYMATGVDDDVTLRANREGFSKFQIRPRRLVDVSRVDTSTELFGITWRTPIILAPVGSQKAFHPEGEIAAARAAAARNHLQILSTAATASVEDVASARGGPIPYQLYPTDTWRVTQALIKRAQIPRAVRSWCSRSIFPRAETRRPRRASQGKIPGPARAATFPAGRASSAESRCSTASI